MKSSHPMTTLLYFWTFQTACSFCFDKFYFTILLFPSYFVILSTWQKYFTSMYSLLLTIIFFAVFLVTSPFNLQYLYILWYAQFLQLIICWHILLQSCHVSIIWKLFSTVPSRPVFVSMIQDAVVVFFVVGKANIDTLHHFPLR